MINHWQLLTRCRYDYDILIKIRKICINCEQYSVFKLRSAFTSLTNAAWQLKRLKIMTTESPELFKPHR